MTFVLRVLTALFVLSLSLTALAQDAGPIVDIPPGVDRIVPLKLKMPAPFEGQLFDNNTALRWANWLKQYKLRLQVDVEEQKKLCLVSTTALKKELVVEQDKYKETVLIYNKQVADLKQAIGETPWYKSIWVGAVLGAVTTATATFVMFLAVR